MPPSNPKNFALSPAASDLGLGDLVTQQLSDDEEERKKKALKMAQGAMQPLGAASMALLGTASGYGG